MESEERKSAVNEVNVLAMLKHPNIVAYYDNFMEDKSLMIAMEYAPGGTLYEFIQERNKNLLDEEVCCHVKWHGTMTAQSFVYYIIIFLLHSFHLIFACTEFNSIRFLSLFYAGYVTYQYKLLLW